MAEKNTTEITTGPENAENRKEAEYDPEQSMLAGAEYTENNHNKVDSKRKGDECYTVQFTPMRSQGAT